MEHTRDKIDIEECWKKVSFNWRKYRNKSESVRNLQNL